MSPFLNLKGMSRGKLGREEGRGELRPPLCLQNFLPVAPAPGIRSGYKIIDRRGLP